MSKHHIIQPPFGPMISAGYVPGISFINKFGYNADIDTATVPEDVWGPGGAYTGFPTGSPETVEIFSSSAEDDENEATPPGTGVWSVRIIGLETSESTEYTTEDITLQGTTPVTSTKSWYRLNRMYALEAGSSGTNVGTLTVRHSTTTSNIFFALPPGFGQTILACWTVPADNVFFLDHVSARCSRSANAVTSALINLQTRAAGTNAWRSRETYQITNSVGLDEDFQYPIRIEGLTDIRMRVTAVGNNDTKVSAGFNGFYGKTSDIRDLMLSRLYL